MFREIILPIFRSTRLCVTACGVMHPHDVAGRRSSVTVYMTVPLDFCQRALHLRRAGNIDAPASILFPRRHLFGLLWEPLPYLNVYSSVTPDDG